MCKVELRSRLNIQVLTAKVPNEEENLNHRDSENTEKIQGKELFYLQKPLYLELSDGLLSIRFAQRHNYTLIWTFNDVSNQPMIAVNKNAGFHQGEEFYLVRRKPLIDAE